MSTIIHNSTVIPSVNMVLGMIEFQNTGDELIFPVDIFEDITTFKPVTLALTGSGTCEIVGHSPKDCLPGDIFPETGVNYQWTSGEDVRVAASSDDSKLIVVSPFLDCSLTTEKIQLSANDTCTINKGSLAIVLCDNFTVNGTPYLFDKFKILSCQSTDANVVALTDCCVIKFTAV